jgi:hypothetical protein
LTALGAVACATSLLLLWLGARQYLSYDGVWHVFIARQESWASFWREVIDNAHPPLFYALLGVAIRALGKAFLAYRAISISAAVLSALLIARIVSTLTSSSLRRACDGTGPCIFRIRVEELGDPAPGCSKNFTADWTCVDDGRRRRTVIAAEAGFGSSALLECGP